MLLLTRQIEVVIQDIDVVMHGAHVAAQCFDLIRQIEQALVRDHPFDPLQARAEILEFDLNRIFIRRHGGRAADQTQGGRANCTHQGNAANHGR